MQYASTTIAGATSVIRQVQALAREGVREVTLLGQNVNSYRDVSEQTAPAPTALRHAHC
jgi:tRNA A37 methylthiotransferase MiaB